MSRLVTATDPIAVRPGLANSEGPAPAVPVLGVIQRPSSRTKPAVEVVTDLSTQQVLSLYDLYLAAFAPLMTKAAARQVLNLSEFEAEMTDPRVVKCVAWAPDGQPIGLTTVTNDLESVPWISPEFYAARFPEHAARGAIYYLGFTLVHPKYRRSSVLANMMSAMLAPVVANRGVVGYDICEHNNTVLRFSTNIERLFRSLSDIATSTVDTQTYYAMEFSGAGPVGTGSAADRKASS